MARTLNARRDPAWTADGHVSDHWLPVSPVTGQLDAFEWRDPLAGVDHTGATIDAEQRALLDAPRAPPPPLATALPAADPPAAVAPVAEKPTPPEPPAPVAESSAAAVAAADKPDLDAGREDTASLSAADEAEHDAPRPPPVIALAHVPDDPGPDTEPPPEEPAVEPASPPPPDGWSRFRARFRS